MHTISNGEIFMGSTGGSRKRGSQIMLDDDLYRGLAAEAAIEGRSISALIREAVAQWLESRRQRLITETPFWALVGSGHSGQPADARISEDVDRYLYPSRSPKPPLDQQRPPAQERYLRSARHSILIDTSALYASLDADDPNHVDARDYLQRARAPMRDTVFGEAMTLITLHLGISLAIRTGDALLAGEPFRIYRLSPEELDETWRIFCRLADKEWSYVDCSVLAVAHRMKIGQVFAFDHHVDQMQSLGLRRVP